MCVSVGRQFTFRPKQIYVHVYAMYIYTSFHDMNNVTYVVCPNRVKELRGGKQVVMIESPPLNDEPSVHGDADLPYVCTLNYMYIYKYMYY